MGGWSITSGSYGTQVAYNNNGLLAQFQHSGCIWSCNDESFNVSCGFFGSVNCLLSNTNTWESFFHSWRISLDTIQDYHGKSNSKSHADYENTKSSYSRQHNFNTNSSKASSAMMSCLSSGELVNYGGGRAMECWTTVWMYVMQDGGIIASKCKVGTFYIPAPRGNSHGYIGGGYDAVGWFNGGDIAGSGKTAVFSPSAVGFPVATYPVRFQLRQGNTAIANADRNTRNAAQGSWRFNARANTTYSIWMNINNTGWKHLKSITYREPDPYPPTGLWANNTGSDNVTTSVYKYSSCSFGIDDTGYLPCTFRVQCFTRDRVSGNVVKRGDVTGWNIGKYDFGYSSSHTCNFNLNLNENVDVYYQVDVWNNKGRRSVTTGTRRLHRIYTEPSNPSNASVTPNRLMQLYDGNQVNYTFTATLNKWGDRPTPCRVYVRQFKNASQIKDVYVREDSRSGEVTYAFSTTTDKSYFGNVLRFNIVKYRDPTWTNNAYTNYVNFYETKGTSSASASLNRTIYTTGKTGQMTYSYKYTKNSSGRFRLYYQVIRMSTAEILQEVNLVNRTTEGTYTNLKVSVRPFPVKGFEGETYVIRIYSEITELFDNKTTSLLYTIPIQFYDAPIAQLHQKPSKPLNSDIINFDSDIEYTCDVWYTGRINKVELRYRLAEVETGYKERTVDITSGRFNYRVPTELIRNSECTAYLHIEYDLGGMKETLDTEKIKLTVTPTRYLYFRTENVSSEYKHNKIHFRTSSGAERTAYKIFLD